MRAEKEADIILNQCYNDYRIKLFNYCLSRLDGSREAADDCVQETFIIFYNKLISGEKFENPRAFLYRTADNFVKRQKQKNAVEAKHRVPLDEARDCAAPYHEQCENIDYDKCAQKLISMLSESEKQLYNMRYQKKMSVEAVSQALGVSRPAVSMRLVRLRNKVEKMVYSSDYEEKGG